MPDSFIVATTGDKVETDAITRPDSVVVQRERVELPDIVQLTDLLGRMLGEIQLTNLLLAQMLELGVDEMETLRTDNFT